MPPRWKLNSINYGTQVLLAAGLLTIIAPVGTNLLHFAFRAVGIELEILNMISRASILLGIILMSLFAVFLAIEFAQDHILDVQYRNREGMKLRVAGDRYECPHCGSQRVRSMDRICPLCGNDIK